MIKRWLIAAAVAAAGALAAPRVPLSAQSAPSKLTNVLADLARSAGTRPQSVDALPVSVQDAIRAGSLRLNENNEVQIYVLLTEASPENLDALNAVGATIEIRDLAHWRVQARIAPARLNAIAALPFVDEVRPPTYAHRRIGQVTTEADPILFTDAVRDQLTVDGSGVRVGVIADGLKGIFATGCTNNCAAATGGPMATGDIPVASGVRNDKGVLTGVSGALVAKSFLPGSDLEATPASGTSCAAAVGAEGTALLEIVHDIAPGAKLSFANADTDLAFNQAVNFLAASNDVVLDALGFYGMPYDGTSTVSKNTAAALNNPDFPVRAYFTAAGNDADRHYFGTYVDSGIDGTTISGISSPGRLHLFQRTADTTDALGLSAQPFNVIQLPQNGQVTIYLTWDDSFGRSGNNYDLYLVQQSTGRVVASSTTVQMGLQDPVETIDFTNRGSADTFRIVIQNVRNGAVPRRLNLFAIQPDCAAAGPQVLAANRHERLNFNTAGRSVAAQADAGGSPVSVVTVGAICSASGATAGASTSNESCRDTSNRTIEFFSSRGPTLDGRTKPDITAIDGVSVTGAGGVASPAFGTSIAAPHMGGIAALLLQSAPCLLGRSTSTIDADAARTAVRDLIVGRSLKVSPTNPDNVFGAGRADGYAAVRATLPRRSGPSTLTFDGNSPFGATLKSEDLGFSDPNGCALQRIKWTGGCGTSPGVSMTCPFGSTDVSVAASNNGFGFADSSDVKVIVTDFALDTAPSSATVAAGNAASYKITVAPQNGPYNSEIKLSCANGNLPPQSSCTFDPESVTPGAKPVVVTMTLSTTSSASGAASRRHGLLVGPGVFDADRFAGPPNAGRDPQIVPKLRDSLKTLPYIVSAIAMLWIGRRRRDRRFVLASAALSVVFLTTAAPSAPASGAAVFPSGLTFGTQTVGTTAPQQFVYLTNTGADTLNIASITASGDFSRVTNCTTTLPAGQSCSVAVSFTPSGSGSRTGTLVFNDDAPGTPQTVSLTGTGQAVPPTSGGTPAGSYSVAVSGTAGVLTHTATVTLVVQ